MSVCQLFYTFCTLCKCFYLEAEQILDDPNEKLTNETWHDIKKLGNYIDIMAAQQDQQQLFAFHRKTNAVEVNQHYFYERMVSQLQLGVLFLRSQLELKKNCFLEEIEILREQLESASSSVRRDEAFFLSWRDKVNLQTQDLENRSCKLPMEITSIKQFS